LQDSSGSNQSSSVSSIVEENAVLKSEKEMYAKKVAKLDQKLRECAKERDSVKSAAISSDSNELKQENIMMKDLLAKSQTLVAESKKIQEALSREVEAAAMREAHLTKELLALKARNEDMGKRIDDQEHELDEFENDFAMARDDARKVVEELRSQLLQLERRNKQLLADGTIGKVEDLKTKLRQLIQQNKRLQTEIESVKESKN